MTKFTQLWEQDGRGGVVGSRPIGFGINQKKGAKKKSFHCSLLMVANSFLLLGSWVELSMDF